MQLMQEINIKHQLETDSVSCSINTNTGMWLVVSVIVFSIPARLPLSTSTQNEMCNDAITIMIRGACHVAPCHVVF